ncbi:MAG TPA: SPFH domain-containing protein [Blastocatellia bacterium]
MAILLLAILQSTNTGTGLNSLTDNLIPILMVVFGIIIFVIIIRTITSRYIRVPPEQALVVYGGGRTEVVTSGARIVWPFLQDSYSLDLTAFQVQLHLKDTPNMDRIPITLLAMATCKISKKPELLLKAAENFGRSKSEEIDSKIANVLEGHLRVVVGQIDMDTILSKRDEFNARISSESATELENLGVEIVVLNIQEVSDPNGVIQAMGAPKIAQIKANAAIRAAEETRRQTIETTNAEREGATTKAQNQTQIAEAERNRDLQTSKYDAEIARQQAITSKAGPLSDAEAQKAVVAAEVAVEIARAEAETGLQEKVGLRNEAEYKATILKKAEAERQQTIIVAEGAAQARVTKAEAERTALQAEGAGQAEKEKAIGLAKAEVTKQTGLAEAEIAKQAGLAEATATEARLLAQAKGTEAEALARAAGVQAELLAQAEGRLKLVQAYANMDEEQRRLFVTTVILDRLPDIINQLGAAGQQIMQPIAAAITSSLGQIQNLTVYDSPHAGNGDGSVSRLLKLGPDVLFQSFQSLKNTGMLPLVIGLLEKSGLDISSMPELNEMVNGKTDGRREPGQQAEVVTIAPADGKQTA